MGEPYQVFLGKRMRLRVPVFSATDRMEAGTVGSVYCVHTYRDGRQAVSLDADGVRIEEIGVAKVERT